MSVICNVLKPSKSDFLCKSVLREINVGITLCYPNSTHNLSVFFKFDYLILVETIQFTLVFVITSAVNEFNHSPFLLKLDIA